MGAYTPSSFSVASCCRGTVAREDSYIASSRISSGDMLTSMGAEPGLCMVNVAGLTEPGSRCPANHDIVSYGFSGTYTSPSPSWVLLNDSMAPDSTPRRFSYEASLVTTNGPAPRRYATAAPMSSRPAPCDRGSFPVSAAVDIRMFFIVKGSYSVWRSSSCPATTAAPPATRGADMLVPPNTVNGS